MADPVITNPASANIPPGVLFTPQRDDWYALDPNISIATLTLTVANVITALTAPGPGIGQTVYLQGWNGATSAASGSPTHPTVALATTTLQTNVLGVITGTTVAGNAVSVPGQLVEVRSYGIAGVVVDNTCTVGHALVQSTGTAGVLHDAGAVYPTEPGYALGTVLAAVTVSSGLGYTLALLQRF
jgi:hypothetical protein